jgi:hypothetical protein
LACAIPSLAPFTARDAAHTTAMTDAEIFRSLDQIAAGLEREAQLSQADREAKREEIVAWFRPLHARLQAAYFERPCPIPWTLVLQDGVEVPPLPEPHECADCFNAVYAEWRRARGRATILSPSKKGAAA